MKNGPDRLRDMDIRYLPEKDLPKGAGHVFHL